MTTANQPSGVVDDSSPKNTKPQKFEEKKIDTQKAEDKLSLDLCPHCDADNAWIVNKQRNSRKCEVCGQEYPLARPPSGAPNRGFTPKIALATSGLALIAVMVWGIIAHVNSNQTALVEGGSGQQPSEVFKQPSAAALAPTPAPEPEQTAQGAPETQEQRAQKYRDGRVAFAKALAEGITNKGYSAIALGDDNRILVVRGMNDAQMATWINRAKDANLVGNLCIRGFTELEAGLDLDHLRPLWIDSGNPIACPTLETPEGIARVVHSGQTPAATTTTAALGTPEGRFGKYVNVYPSNFLKAEPEVTKRLQTLLWPARYFVPVRELV